MHFTLVARIELDVDLGTEMVEPDDIESEVAAAVMEVLRSPATRERLDDMLRARLGTLGQFDVEVIDARP
jgi:hypothetical protein